MSEAGRPGNLTIGQMTKLRNRIAEIEPYLEEERFSTPEISDDPRSKHIVRWLKERGAVYQVDTTKKRREHSTDRLALWEWVPAVREELLDYKNSRDTLKCGHRPHVWQAPGFDGLMCKVCMEHGIRTSLDKEEVRDLL